MTASSTTIRVSVNQRDRLRRLAEEGERSMAATLDDALEALRRARFYRSMADAEAAMADDPELLAGYRAERDEWLNADLSAP